jgi:hypothetical protein
MDNTYDAMKASGCDAKAPVYVAGHGNAASHIVTYLSKSQVVKATGIINMGYFLPSSSLPSITLPVLTLAAELDGVFPISRAAQAWYHQTRTPAQATQFPVIVISGASHAQFAVGNVSNGCGARDQCVSL